MLYTYSHSIVFLKALTSSFKYTS